ncbi:MAG: cobyrinate a,c-diamide synthase, partial [Kiloniellales bacterium]|nr:cobyrinate a,c-diamide synthase [Kiloniellales bacterium]
MTRGLIIAAPASGSGKTLVTLALLRHLRRAGVAVGSAKVGPDYIDGAFHRAAGGRPCFNLDTWAMRPETLRAIAGRAGEGAELVLAEGVMGLFDGAPTEGPGPDGSTADLAAATGWPVVLVVDARGMGASAAALVQGYAGFRDGVRVAGVVFNRVGGPGHGEILRQACAPLGIPVLGALPRRPELDLPDRHLGLVQAGEHGELEELLDRAAAWVADAVDVDGLLALARPAAFPDAPGAKTVDALPPLGQRIAVARDTAFAFAYPHVLEGWRAAGAEVLPFSPLADEAPDPAAVAVFLPGGYPELNAGRLAAAGRFKDGLRRLAADGALVYGECGGYMVLGRGLVDGEGERHAMVGLLALETSFEAPRMTLGYRAAQLTDDGPLGPAGAGFRGHEFHFAQVLGEEGAPSLFTCTDARGR